MSAKDRRGFLWCATSNDDRQHAHGKSVDGIVFGVRLCDNWRQICDQRYWRKNHKQPRARCQQCRELAGNPAVRALMAVRL